MKKKPLIAVISVIIIGVIWYTSSIGGGNSGEFTIGAILPLSGPAAIWGENVRKGMDLALQDKPEIKVLYEDSKGVAADGVSAFNLLKEKKVNLMMSILSAVSVSVSKVANDQKMPLFATLTAADAVPNDYTTRYYSNAQNFAESAFTASTSPLIKVKKLAVLYRNDELGNAVEKKIEELSVANGKEVIFKDSFKPGETDFSTIVLKAKNANADALLFVPVTPGEAVGILKMAKQLNVTIPLVEESNVFADLKLREQVAGIEFYTNAYNFSAPDNALEFKKLYMDKYGTQPNFAVAFGYDAINLIYKCKDKKQSLQTCLRSQSQNEGVTGLATQIAAGDFNVPMHLEKVN